MENKNRFGHPKFHELLEEIGELHNRKNYDYAEGMAEGPLGNFLRISGLMKNYPDMDWSTPTGVALIYALKQFDAAMTMLSTGKTSKTGEGLGERMRDVAIYALLAIILNEEA